MNICTLHRLENNKDSFIREDLVTQLKEQKEAYNTHISNITFLQELLGKEEEMLFKCMRKSKLLKGVIHKVKNRDT